MTPFCGWFRRASVLAAACALQTFAHAQSPIDGFSYYAPGVMMHSSDVGATDRRIYYPSILFPIRVGPSTGADGGPLHAYPNSQVYLPPGFEMNDVRAYAYPWVDTLCESHHVGGAMPLCPNMQHQGHQGVDIRPHSPRREFYDVIAAEDGKVTNVTPFTYVQIRWASNDGRYCEYEHLSPILVTKGQNVKKGDVIGKFSNIMGRKPDTSIHLHFQCGISDPDRGKVLVPMYASLIAAYQRAWSLPDPIQNGELVKDPVRERDGPVARGSP